MSLQSMALSASALKASTDPYHPPSHSNAPLDVLLAVIAGILLVLAMIIPPTIARNRELRRTAAGEDHPETS